MYQYMAMTWLMFGADEDFSEAVLPLPTKKCVAKDLNQ